MQWQFNLKRILYVDDLPVVRGIVREITLKHPLSFRLQRLIRRNRILGNGITFEAFVILFEQLVYPRPKIERAIALSPWDGFNTISIAFIFLPVKHRAGSEKAGPRVVNLH